MASERAAGTDSAWAPDSGWWAHRPVLVTGATGFLGTHLTGLLVDLGAAVTVIRRDHVPPSSLDLRWLDRVTWVEGEVEDQALVERVLGEHAIRTVFHLAAQTQVGVSNRNPISTFETNIRGSWAVFEAVRRSPLVDQVVTASSDKAYGSQPELPYTEDMPLNPVHPYDVSKACADLIATSYHATWGVPVAVTRCGNFFGPGDRNWDRLVPGTIRSLLRGESPIIRSDGSLVRDYLYVVDGASAYIQLAEALAGDCSLAGTAFNFSTETPLTVLELFSKIQHAVGSDLVPKVLGNVNHEIQAQHLSAALARDTLGWRPSRSIDEALAETVAWYRLELRSSP